jgi:hypothetical protein
MIGQIKNIRFTYQFTSANVSLVRNIGERFGVAGGEPAAATRRPFVFAPTETRQ